LDESSRGADESREPLELRRSDSYDLWLDPGMRDATAASELLKPFDARLMRSYPVRVGSTTCLTTTKNALDLWKSPRFRIGYSHSTMTNDDRMQRKSSLIATIKKKLPEFAKTCADDKELVLLHQDAFAADYQEDEYALLGMAIKYAGLRGKEVRVIGRNRQTLGQGDTIQ
jgi:hypothetical protein